MLVYCGHPNPCTCQLPGIDTTDHFRPVPLPLPLLRRRPVVESLVGDDCVVVVANGNADEDDCVAVAVALALELRGSAGHRKAVVWNPSGASS